jgi:hypothetical protein
MKTKFCYRYERSRYLAACQIARCIVPDRRGIEQARRCVVAAMSLVGVKVLNRPCGGNSSVQWWVSSLFGRGVTSRVVVASPDRDGAIAA